jgi:hypothetical protein
MKRILLITITPTIKVQILRSLASWKALLIPYLYNFFQKINIHHHLKPSCPKQQWPKFGHCGPLGVKHYILKLHQTLQILLAIAITRGHSNNKPPINTMVKFIQMDDKLFKMDKILFNWMNTCQIG